MRFRITLALILVICCGSALADTLRCPAQVTSMEVSKGEYSPMPGAVFGLTNFSARMVARGKSSPMCFNRVTDISHGEVFVSSESLTHMFDQKISQSNSKMRDVKVEIRDASAHITGTMKKGVDVHFELEGPVTTDGTNLIFHATKIKADGLPVKALLGMLGKHLGTMLGSENIDGVKAKDDTLIFEPISISHVRGRIGKLALTSKGLLLDFEAPANNTKIAAVTKNKAQGSK